VNPYLAVARSATWRQAAAVRGFPVDGAHLPSTSNRQKRRLPARFRSSSGAPAVAPPEATMMTFRNLSLALLAGTALFFAETGLAQTQGSTKGPGVVVTATRVPTDPARIASSTTVITAEEIERRQLRSVPELLQAVPGLAVVQSGGTGQITSVFSRGAESNHTLFLINGVEAADPSSNATFSIEHLLVGDIERVEVIRGPQSVLYGSDAIGAVVNIITKRGAGAPSMVGKLEGGSFGTISGSAGVSGAEGALDYAVSANRFHTDGVSAFSKRIGGGENDAYDNLGATANLGYRASELLTLRGFAKLLSADVEFDEFGNEAGPHIDSRHAFGQAEAELNLLDGLWVPTLGLSATHVNRETKDALFGGEFTGSKIKLDLQNDFYVSDQHTITIGGESEWDHGEGRGGFPVFDEDLRNQALYAQDQFAFWNRLFGTIGARLDHHSEFGSEVTWRIAPAYLIHETGTKLKASYGTGFKAPSLEDLFGGDGTGFIAGNPDLQPEKSRGWDAGFEQSLFEDRLSFGSTYFRNEIEDLITIVSFTAPPPIQPENVSEAETWGIESFIAVTPVETVTLRLDHTWLKTRDQQGNADLLRRPEHKLNLDVSYRPTEKVTLSFDVLYVGKREDVNAVAPFGRVKEDPYTVVSLSGSWQVRSNLRLFGRVENLLDEDYEDPSGFGQPGIGVFAGLEARL
jgi:vitamin B12 transporter